MNPLRQQQIDAVLRLNGPARYEHFIKEVACNESAWGLYLEGWGLAATQAGAPVFPLWPAAEYAQRCASGQWMGHEPEEIPLTDLLAELLPSLKRDGVLPGIFYTPDDHGVIPTHDQLAEDLKTECQKYE